MKTLFLDCSNGAAGDMISAALWELVEDRDGFLNEINNIGLPGVKVYALPSVKQDVGGTHFSVTYHGETEQVEDLPKHSHEEVTPHVHSSLAAHHHTHLNDIVKIIQSLRVSDGVKENATAVYRLIAEAEATVHGTTPSEVHFHEVGSMDAVADVVCVSLLMEKLHPDVVLASSVQTGTGKVKCAHGIIPVPAPATSYLLQGIPIYSGETNGELCTPTGAAILKHFVHKFGPLPVMNIESIGYGMGSKDYDFANYLRAFYGDSPEEVMDDLAPQPTAHVHHSVNYDEVQKKAILNRISRSIGHLNSVKRMVEEDRDASDVLIQLSAVESSIKGTSRAIMKDHLRHAIHQAEAEGRQEDLDNLSNIIDKFLK